MLYLFFLTIGLSVFWLLMSGFWDNPLLLGFGVISILICLFISWRIEKKFPFYEGISFLPGLPAFWLWLFREVIFANIDVLKCIWLPEKYPLSPTIRTLTMSQKTRLGKTTYANAITLTPGTISMHVENNEVTVYSLLAEAIDDLEKGDMDKRVSKLEKKIL